MSVAPHSAPGDCAQVSERPNRPGRDLRKITCPVERWRAIVACREYDQKYFPSESHEHALRAAHRALDRAVVNGGELKRNFGVADQNRSHKRKAPARLATYRRGVWS